MQDHFMGAEEACSVGPKKSLLHFFHKGFFAGFTLYKPEKRCAIILWRNQSW